MQCDFCSNDASIEILMIVNGQEQKVHLCPSCYREKVREMILNMPQEWGGGLTPEQLEAMLQQAEEAAKQGGFRLNVFHPQTASKPETTVPTATSARELAFEEQLRNLKAQRAEASRALQLAMDREDYESCAMYRDQIAEIGDALIRLNEERKDPHGV